MMRPRRIAFIGMALAICAGAGAAPVAPSRDTVVETQLLPRAVKASVQRLAAIDTAPRSAAESVAAARRLIDAGRASGDPRTLGYAEAVLAPWPTDDAATPLEVMVLRATIEQSRHRFDAATALLDHVIARAPEGGPTQVQALLTRASIAQVRGELQAAAADCQRLRPLHADVAAVCGAMNDALTGHNRRAVDTLRGAIARTEGAVRAWALGVLAQVHEQLGEAEAAAHSYRAALASGDDLVTRLAYVDLLIGRRAHAEARSLLADAAPADGVVLRRWQIERSDDLESQLQARFGEAEARGDLLHARDMALFALERGDATRALRLARANWRVQREPADLLVLARAARAAVDGAALAEVRAWLRDTGLADARVHAILGGGGA
jgi:tetratricopeptide (TPR) repeat protein